MLKEYIPRPLYIDKIRPFIGKDLIKVLVGQRRSGKSYLLYELMDVLIGDNNYKKENIIYINKESREFKDISCADDLEGYLKRIIKGKRGKKALFIDEVQEIDGFEKVLRSLQSEEGWDIYISGSNANILSSELSTYLSGRYIEIEVFPLSYGEFLKFHELKKGKESFNQYIKYGGLPYLIHLDLEDDIVYGYLRSVYDSILLKDVVKRYALRNVNFLQRLVLFLSDNIGSIVSAKKISDYLLKEKTKMSPSVVVNYLAYMDAVYFIFDVKRQEIGKRIFEIGSKHYFADLGMRHSLVPYASGDIGKILENLVYLHLRRSGYDVVVGRVNAAEIDFVAQKGAEKMYVQVAYLLKDKKTIEREFGNLLAIEDNYPKVVVTVDDYAGEDYKGIKVVNILDFLQ